MVHGVVNHQRARPLNGKNGGYTELLSYTECRIFSQTKKATEALRIKALAVFAKSFPDGSSDKIVKNVL